MRACRSRRPSAPGLHYRAAVPLDRLDLPADARWWPLAAQAVVRFAAAAGAPPRRLDALTWLVPAGAHALLARSALRGALGGEAFAPPRIAPLQAWLGRPLRSAMGTRAELFAALRDNSWVREAFGGQPAALWALAAAIAESGDELTLAAVGDADAFATRLEASLARHFHRRAARAMQPQAQLVLQLWRARRGAGDGAAGAVRELQVRAAAAAAPLVYLTADLTGGPAPWEQAFLEDWAGRAPVLLLAPSARAALTRRPLLAAAWPELGEGEPQAAIAARGEALRGIPALAARPLSIVGAASLEDEAAAVARQVLDWLGDGVGGIALVSLDRLTARRVRALLERAQVAVLDETGWKLATTSAAASVMRWYDLVADDLYWRDLLDWLKSSFTLAGRPGKADEAAFIERAVRAEGVLQGAAPIRRALAARTARAEQAATATGAREVIDLLAAQAQAMRRAPGTLAGHLRALGAALDALGMRGALDGDPVGRSVLRELAALEAEVAAVGGRATLEEFRALLAARFEETAHVDTQLESPVAMVSLAATALRPFDAAVLIGADAGHLPAAPEERLFLSNAVRAELGLATAERAMREQAAQLVALLATVPRVLATWRTRRGDEPNSLSPLLQRLQLVADRALGERPLQAASRESFAATPTPQRRPAPSAATLLPQTLSASRAQALVDCAYRFYARVLLRLEEPRDVIEMPEKRDFGEALHRVLHAFHSRWAGADLAAAAPQELAASLRAHAAEVFGAEVARAPGMLAFRHRFDRLVGDYVDWLRAHAAQGWRWMAGEAEHRRPFDLDDGRPLTLVGRLDRVEENPAGAVMVIDYKARPPEALRRALQAPGEDIQLPFYSLLLPRPAESAAYVGFDRAREDRAGVEAVVPPQPFDELARQVGERLRTDLRRIAAGAPLPAIGAEAVCGYCEMRGLCRREHWADGDDGNGRPPRP
jgi:ATP-dependent helicase/nuclease subunit B